MARQSCAMVPRWQFLATLLRPVFSASHLQHVSDLHLKFAIRPHHVWKYGSHIPSGDNKNLKPALVVLYDVQPENGSGLFLQPEDLYGSVTVREFTLLPYLPTRKHRWTDFKVIVLCSFQKWLETINAHSAPRCEVCRYRIHTRKSYRVSLLQISLEPSTSYSIHFFATHAHTIATCFAVVSILYHLFLVFQLLTWNSVNLNIIH